MIPTPDHVEAIARQAEIERLYERACGETLLRRHAREDRLPLGVELNRRYEDQILTRLYPGEIPTLEDYVSTRLRGAIAVHLLRAAITPLPRVRDSLTKPRRE